MVWLYESWLQSLYLDQWVLLRTCLQCAQLIWKMITTKYLCLQFLIIASAWSFCALEPFDETNQFNEMVVYGPGKSDILLNWCSDWFDLINQISVLDTYSWVDDETLRMNVIKEVILGNNSDFNSRFLLIWDEESNTKMMPVVVWHEWPGDVWKP